MPGINTRYCQTQTHRQRWCLHKNYGFTDMRCRNWTTKVGLYLVAFFMLLAVAAGLLFGVLAAIIPARQAARMEIVQALRYE